MNEKQYNEWSKIRNKGKSRYVLLYGVLIWGTATGILTGFFVNFLNHEFTFAFLNTALFWFDILARIIFFQIAGIIFGLWTWNSSEKKWEKEKIIRNY